MGARRCVFVAPAAFELGGDGIATLVSDAVVDGRAVEAARECPNRAIEAIVDGVTVVTSAE